MQANRYRASTTAKLCGTECHGTKKNIKKVRQKGWSSLGWSVHRLSLQSSLFPTPASLPHYCKGLLMLVSLTFATSLHFQFTIKACFKESFPLHRGISTTGLPI